MQRYAYIEYFPFIIYLPFSLRIRHKPLCSIGKCRIQKAESPIAPPTTLKIPKSEAPKDASINRVVNNEVNTVIPILMYKKQVFFITLFAVDIIHIHYS